VTQDDHSRFLLADIVVSPPHNQLSLQGRTLSLQPKVMAVLCYLARHSDRVVSNDELLDQVWQGRVVTHASVQKSMNTLRNALAELAGEREFVAHFSKRGYQLVVPVRFEPVETEAAGATVPGDGRSDATFVQAASHARRRKPGAIGLALPLAIGLLALLVWVALRDGDDLRPKSLVKHHATVFTSSIPLSTEGQRERNAEFHPDGKRMAYIRDLTISADQQSQILIKGPDGSDWLLASAEGSWVDLAWSPSGRNLVATEIRRAEGLPKTPDYFEKPNNLYSFHIFTLDFRGERLLEKNLLSQWQGVVASVTWWDENTLEFVASLGPGSANERYRYLIAEQKLSALNPLNAGFVPLQSVVHDKRTAVVSRRRNTVQLEFLDANQDVMTTVPLSTAALDISWIPDGTGLLMLDKSGPALYTLDLQGEMSPVQLPQGDTHSFSHPRYRRDGQAIVLTSAEASASLSLQRTDGSRERIGAVAGALRLARFLPDGAVIFTVDNPGEPALWRWRNGGEKRLQVTEKPLEDLIVAADGQSLVYRSRGTIWQLPLQGQQPLAIWQKAGAVEPIFYSPETHELLFIRRSGDARNIWRRHLHRQEERQITFGSVGTVMALAERLYFQYSDQPGLWRLDWAEPNPVQISKRLPKNSKLLQITDTTAFFVTGGPCRESSLHSLDLRADTLAEVAVAERDQAEIISQDFRPAFGILQTECRPADLRMVQLLNSAENAR
jgi:DNA-binding winged helix-turn-helix (wHTH) protein